MAQETPLSDIELGFVRKRDGKTVNVKLFEIFKNFKTIDFINNEVVLNGETYIANSFRNPYYEVQLNVVKNSVNGGNVTYQINGVSYDGNQSLTVEKDSQVTITIIPAQGSVIESVQDETGHLYEPVNGVVMVTMSVTHTLTINFNVIPPQ
ncbi:MAG: hypothetical protein HY840_08245 [Bacteroidetes bacterium]|nr:hypothetical protein [Bacteroidota bacterium]